MTFSIRHFIWGYQRHFQIAQESFAQRVFRRIDGRFEPEVFLVGIEMDGDANRHPACVEPEDDFWIDSGAFNDVRTNALDTIKTDPESAVHHSNQLAQQWHEDRLVKKAIQANSNAIVHACQGKPKGMSYWPSMPVKVNGYLVMLFVGLQQRIVELYPQLESSDIHSEHFPMFKASRSFIGAVVTEYLNFVLTELTRPNVGADLVVRKDIDEIFRAAGQRMMVGIGRRIDVWENQYDAENGLFGICNKIAATKYEKATGRGTFALARRNHSSMVPAVTFERPAEIGNARLARKLLQLSASNYVLHMNAYEAWGLASTGAYDGTTEDLFEIAITDHHHWQVSHKAQVLMQVRDGLPMVPKPLLDVEVLRDTVNRVLGIARHLDVNQIVSIAQAAALEAHGTTLVISEDALHEAARLEVQSIRLQPCHITPQTLRTLTPIDGAILVDPAGICHGIGVILDGIAGRDGSATRGARYNSAVRYLSTTKMPCVIIVVSSDGGVDILPSLPPQIKRSEIDRRLVEMEAISRVEVVRRARYVKLREWFNQHSAYLKAVDCDQLDQLVSTIESRLVKQEPLSIQVTWPPFAAWQHVDPTTLYCEETAAHLGNSPDHPSVE